MSVNATSAYICDWDAEQGIITVLVEYFGPEASDLERVSDLGGTYNLREAFENAAEWLETPMGYDIIHVDDPDIDPKEREHLTQYGAKSTLAIPLIVDGKSWGYIELWESRHRRDFTHEEIELIQAIAYEVSMIINNANLYEALRESEEKYRVFMDDFQGIAYQMRLENNGVSKPLSFHGAVKTITGYLAEDFTSERVIWNQIIHPDDLPLILQKDERLLAEPGCIADNEYRILRNNGEFRWVRDVSLATSVGKRSLLQGTVYDITDRKQAEERINTSLQEKEILLKEIHHRVKNNLQIISSLLVLQSETSRNSQVDEVLMESRNRIHSMATIHEILCHSDNLARVDFAHYTRVLTNHLLHSYNINTKSVALKINIVDVPLSINTAIYCGLIINELVSNSLKYAFPANQTGEICIELSKAGDNQLILTVRDDGVGLPPGVDIKTAEGLGLQLVAMLTQQLEGKVELDRGRGTVCIIVFNPKIS